MPDLEPILKKLATTRREMLCSADSVPSPQWRTNPSAGRWSAGELIAHLTVTERFILSTADRITQKPPKHWPFYRRLHLPLVIVEKRLIRRKSPLPVPPELLGDKEAMLAEFREVRERTLAFLEETSGRDLSVYCWRHPFIGTLNLYEWVLFIGSHEIRHMKQMREIAGALPKSVASLHI